MANVFLLSLLRSDHFLTTGGDGGSSHGAWEHFYHWPTIGIKPLAARVVAAAWSAASSLVVRGLGYMTVFTASQSDHY